jgi:hypothetical protein
LGVPNSVNENLAFEPAIHYAFYEFDDPTAAKDIAERLHIV